MRQRLKISLSLLISLLLCGGFAVFSFTRLFDIVETTFFQPRIIAEREAQLEEFSKRISRYHRDNIERFQPAVQEPFVWRAFLESNQQAQEDIINRQIFFGRLLDDYPNIQLIRFLGVEAKRIHFSTSDRDIESQDQERRKYVDYDKTGETVDSTVFIAKAGEAPRLIIDGSGQRFIYSFPVVDSFEQYRGLALFYVSKRDLSEYLLRFPTLDFRELSLVGQRGLVINFPAGAVALIAPTLSEVWQQIQSQDAVYREAVVFDTIDDQRENYSLLSITTEEFGSLSLVIPYSVFQLQPIMKVVIIAAVSLTVFLIIFLLFNLRQDPLPILSQRLKRLQLSILQEFIEGNESIDWKRWRDELKSSKGELKSRIKRGVGRIPEQKETKFDEMIDKSWDEIISVIEARIGGPQREAVDISHLEQLLQSAVDRFQITAQLPVQVKAPVRRAGIVVEEIGIDEVVEPGQVIPSEEAEEAEAVEEVEEIEEAEAVEEVEEIEEAEAVEEVEEIEEAEAVEEVEEIGEEQETLEVLEEVKEIVPLPPLPQEELTELPSADEEQKSVSRPMPVPRQPEKKPPQQPAAAAEGKTAEPGETIEELEVAEDEAAPIESILSAGEELVMETQGAEQLRPEEIEKIQQLDEQKQLQGLLDSGVIRAYTLNDIEALIMEQRTSVVMENGVYRIKDEIITGAAAGKSRRRRGLKALAEASLSKPLVETGGFESGIGALLGEDSILDLENEIGQIRERSVKIDYTSPGKVKKIQFFEDGLDYDGYLKGFRRGKTETDKLRSLVELSGKLKAVSAAIFSKENGKYCLKLKVGLHDPGFEIVFTPDEPFVKMFVEPRQTVIISEKMEKVKALAKKLHPEDLKYIQGAIVLPAVFGNQESFLLLGLPVLQQLDIKDIITRLDIY